MRRVLTVGWDSIRGWASAFGLGAGALFFFQGCGDGVGPAKRTDQVEIVPKEAKQGAQTIAFSELEVPPKPKMDQAELIALGKKVYDLNCAVCHGPKGEGKGDAAPFLVPRPRSFGTANYRLRTTPTGALPTDEDLFKSISLGMPGTPMPPWRHILNDEERWALVEYVKTFSPKFQEETKPQIVAVGEPPPENDQAVKRGHELFVKYACNTCHGTGERGMGPPRLRWSTIWDRESRRAI